MASTGSVGPARLVVGEILKPLPLMMWVFLTRKVVLSLRVYSLFASLIPRARFFATLCCHISPFKCCIAGHQRGTDFLGCPRFLVGGPHFFDHCGSFYAFVDVASGRFGVFSELGDTVMCCCLSKNVPPGDFQPPLQSSCGRTLISRTTGLLLWFSGVSITSR